MTSIHSLQVVRCAKAQPLLKLGAQVEALYVVQSGALRHSAPGVASRTLRRGDHFGEEALTGLGVQASYPGELSAGSAATVSALEDSVLYRITRESFMHCVGALQEIRQEHFSEKALVHAHCMCMCTACTSMRAVCTLHAHCTYDLHCMCMYETPRYQALASCAELAALSIAERRQICKLMSRVSYPAGSTIVKEGGQLAQLHVIHAGEVCAYEHGKPTATLGEGRFFGQASLFRHVSAASALVAQRPTSCTVVSRESVQRQLGPLAPILEREAAKQSRKQAAGRINFASLEQRKVLGVGTFGTVRLVVAAAEAGGYLQGERQAYALKCMRKARVHEMGQVKHTLSQNTW